MNILGKTLALLTISLFALALESQYAFSENLKVRTKDSAYDSAFVQHLINNEQIESKNATKLLPAPLSVQTMRKKWSYDEIVDSLSVRTKQIAKLYPPGVLSEMNQSLLKGFSGKHEIHFPVTFSTPFLLICPSYLDRLIDISSIQAETLSVSYQGKTIHGLRVHGTLRRYNPFQRISMRYMESLNARLLGFTHGQIIEKLSENIKAAKKFDYNGPHSWSEHQHNGPLDQFEKPIRLTNAAHALRDRYYVVSRHPDFSLDLSKKNPGEVRITFFLWRENYLNTMLSYVGKAPERAPDFVFQLNFNSL